MKRDPSLNHLSSEHHTALVLARRIRAALTDATTDTTALWHEVVAGFRDQFEPHFQKEECGLLRALQATGQNALVNRTCQEHQLMRELVATGGPESLARMAQLLTDHVRFEERELFAVAQAELSESQLKKCAQAGQQ